MDSAPPFTESEKRFMLAEAIKNSSLPVEKLIPVVIDGSIIPDWRHMLIPHGRNLQSCIDAYDALRNNPSQPPPFHSYNPVMVPAPPPRPTGKRKSGPAMAETLSSSSKRRQSDITQHILPKPSNGSPGFNPSQSATQPKKRGRPSKAIVEQRQAEAIARGEVIAPPQTKSELQLLENASTPLYAAIAPMVSPRPIGSPMTPVAFEQIASPEADSPGKRRRAKPAPKSRITHPSPGQSSFSILNPYPGEAEATQLAPIAATSRELIPILQPAPSSTPRPIQSQSHAPPPTSQAPPPPT